MADGSTRAGRRAAGAALGVLLCLGTTATMGWAQTRGAPGVTSPLAGDGSSAAQRYREGVSLARQGRWPEAYEAYLSAWTIKQHFQIAANLARAEMKLGRHRDAAEHLGFFLREAEGVSATDRATAQRMLDEAKAKIATVTFVVSRAEAEVLVDGVAVGTSPLGREVYVEPGLRSIEARRSGEAPAKASVALEAGESRQVALRFEEPTPAPEIQAPRPAAPAARAGDGGGPSKAVIVAGSVATGLGLGAAVVLKILSDQRAEQGSESVVAGADSCYRPGPWPLGRDACLEVDERRRDAARLGTASSVALVAAGALGAVTVAYALYGSFRGGSRTAVTAAPVLSASGAGVSLSARW